MSSVTSYRVALVRTDVSEEHIAFQKTVLFDPTQYSSTEGLIKTHSTKQLPINNCTVTDKLVCGGTVQEALFVVRR
jgi:hypothetical protein